MMKRIKYYILSALLLGFVSCNDLALIPESQLTKYNFPLTDNDAIAAVNGVYVANSDLSSASSYVGDLPGDATQCGEEVTSGSGASIGIYQHDPGNGTVTSVWTTLYSGITSANAAIDDIAAATGVSEALKTRLTGEAKFLRALYYFYLVQLFGEVPVVLHPDEGTGATRAPIDEVYTQIVKDLTDASVDGVLPESYSGDDAGRATNGAAHALLAKVYLVWAQTSTGADAASRAGERYTAAINTANSVKGYSLQEEFLDNWNTSKRNGKENIFSAHHVVSQLSAGDGGNHLAHCAFATSFSNTTPHLVVSDISFYNKFDDRDQRKAGSYAIRIYNPDPPQGHDTITYIRQDKDTVKAYDGNYFVFELPRYRKYIDTINILTTNNTRSIDRTILRYAEVLLIKAEAQNERDKSPNEESREAINQVRRRAFRQPLAEASADDIPAGLSYEQFRDTLRNERFLEFVYEQQRWFDLVRWRILVKTVQKVGKNAYTDKSGISPKHYRFPIPRSQRNINPEGLWQNWGWDDYDEAKTGANPYAGFE
jgi:hypothetical protein